MTIAATSLAAALWDRYGRTDATVGALGRTHGRDEATQRGMEELTRDNVEPDESYFVLNLAADW